MTSMVQFRLWLREASAAERAATAIATTLVVCLVAWALGPAPTERTERVSDAGAPVPIGSDSGAADGVAINEGGGSGSVDSGGVGTTNSSRPASDRGDLPGSLLAGDATPTDSGATQGAGPATPLRATDRGVTADSIKVGFTVIDFSGAETLGITPNLRSDSSRAIDALVDYANKRGGVLGRRIQPVKVEVNPRPGDHQTQGCVEFTETHGVFAVVDSFAFPMETSAACITAVHKTLLLNGIPGSSENVRRNFPYHVSVKKDDNRKMKDLATAAKVSGFFDPDKGFRKLGIFGEECVASASVFDSPTEGLKAYLRAAGVKEWSDFRGDCDPTGAQRAGAQAVVQFKNDGVSHVLLAARPPVVDGYLRAANQADYYPEYFAGDYVNLALGGFTDRYEPKGFDGAMGVTMTYAGQGAMGQPLPHLTQTCSTILTDHGLEPVSAAPPRDIGDDLEVLELCENFLLFLQVATEAGPNLTRASWAIALPRTGDFRAATVDLARFDRSGKMTGGDTTKLIQWHRSCSCWKGLTDFEPAAG